MYAHLHYISEKWHIHSAVSNKSCVEALFDKAEDEVEAANPRQRQHNAMQRKAEARQGIGRGQYI